LTSPFATELPSINGTSGTWTATAMLAVVRRPLGGRTVSFIEKGKPVSVVNNTTRDFEIQTVASRYGIPRSTSSDRCKARATSERTPTVTSHSPLISGLSPATPPSAIGKVRARSMPPAGTGGFGATPTTSTRLGHHSSLGSNADASRLQHRRQTTFLLGGGPVFSRKRLPFQSLDSDVRTSIAGSSRSLNAEPTYPGTLWSWAGRPQLVSPPPRRTRDTGGSTSIGRGGAVQALAAGETLNVSFDPITFDGQQ